VTKKNPKIDALLAKAKRWRGEMEALRAILLGCPLSEEIKWGQACYTLDGANIVLIHGFKDYCALLFFKGALMKDPKGLLIQQTENVQAARQIRVSALKEISAKKAVLKAYVMDAIRVEKAGLKPELKKTAEFKMPVEFKRELERLPALKDAFEALTPGRQRAYLLHFNGAKQSKTREARVEKCMPKILDGLGLDD
jgi:uncharacterized protein YdeI (YjbR/CyaY-like superfamily)